MSTHYVISQLVKAITLENNTGNSTLTIYKQSSDRLVLKDTFSSNIGVFIVINIVPINSIRYSLIVTGSLQDVSDTVYRNVRNFIDEIATRASLITIWSKKTDVFGLGVKYKAYPSAVNISSLSKQLHTAIEELRIVHSTYQSEIDDFLLKHNCPPSMNI